MWCTWMYLHTHAHTFKNKEKNLKIGMMPLNSGEKVLHPKALTVNNFNREGVRGQGPHDLEIPAKLISNKSESCHLTLQAC